MEEDTSETRTDNLGPLPTIRELLEPLGTNRRHGGGRRPLTPRREEKLHGPSKDE